MKHGILDDLIEQYRDVEVLDATMRTFIEEAVKILIATDKAKIKEAADRIRAFYRQ